MGLYGSKPNAKRQRIDDSQDDQQPRPCKQQRLTTTETTITSPTKITDLNDDCLAKCFVYLNLPSLFAVSVSNEWLRPAANFVYKRKFGTKKVQIKNKPFPFWLDVDSPHVVDNCINISGLKTGLQFLRCMGSAIDNLTIGYLQFNCSKYDYIHQYVNKYCAESLTSIVFQDKSYGMIKHFDKPFVNVQTVAVYHSFLAHQLQLFPEWFPNMRALELRDIKLLDHSMAMPFKHLRDLIINITDGKFGLSKRMAARLFHSSPQLRHLKIRVFGGEGLALGTLLNIIEANQLVCKLNVIMENHSVEVLPWDVGRLVTEHPALIELDLTGYIFKVNDVLVVIKQHKQLTKFRFQLKNALVYRGFVAEVKKVRNQWKSSICDEYLYQRRYIVTLER